MKPETEQLRAVQSTSWIRTVTIAILSIAIGRGALMAQDFTAANADAVFEAHTKAFYRERDDRAWYTKDTEGGRADFWTQAEQLEMVLDVYERTKNPQHIAMFTKLFHGFLADHGRTWERNEFNDDIMWMVIACTRAHLMSGNPEFREVARANFDLCYARAASPDLGGGLWWKVDNKSKNACVNGPGAIAAFLLSKATGEADYLTKARELFLWERATLFDPSTGRVFDNININGRVGRFALTYNQGTFVGAANLLGYNDEARLAAFFTMNTMCRDGYLPPGGEKGDGGGFNGIAVRWIARFVKDCGQQSTFQPWLQKNAAAAWKARRAADNLSWCRWPEPTPEDRRFSWGCSNAVVMLQVVAPSEGYKRVEQADFGKTKDGVAVKLVTLRNAKGMSAQITTYGAIIKELQAPDRNGKFTNVVLTTDSLAKFENGFSGAAAIIGRVINRIAGAQFELDGATYKLTANSGKNTIHGGSKGFAQSVWTVENITANPNESAVKLVYLSKDGEEGFPGNLKTSVTYALTDNNELRIDYEAETDMPTIVNLTNHAYWNLAGGGSCLDNILWIPSESYTPADADLIVTGEILPLKGTLMDFNQPTRIGDRIEQLKPKMAGYDYNYILGEGNGIKMAARLTDPDSGRTMEVRTTQPAVQLYTANHLNHTAICLETQHFPDAIHHKNFPSIVVRPGSPLRESTLFSFLAK